MPTVLRIGPYRFFFYANEGHEPRHIHVARDNAEVKFWLDPVCADRSIGFSSSEILRIQKLVEAHCQEIRSKWDEYFAG